MLSIGRFAQLAQVSPRTIRYYESIGLIESGSRGENNYRYYDARLVDKVEKIRDLQGLGFSLDEIKDIVQVSPSLFVQNLRKKLEEVDAEMVMLRERRSKLKDLLSVSLKVDSQESINDTERKQYMDAIHDEILTKLKEKHGAVSEKHLQYLKRDRTYATEEQQDFLRALNRCLDFAKERNLRLGPVRGGAPSSLVLHALGANPLDPTQHEGFFPERLLTQAPEVHIDVEFERGQEFVDFCKETNRSLKYGKIEAFKMPFLDIMNNIDARLGTPVDYDSYDADSDVVLKPFRTGDLEKIFDFDISPGAMIEMLNKSLPGYAGSEAFKNYVRSQKIHSFRDVINITAVWRPYSQEMIDHLNQYRAAKINPVKYDCLAPELQESLKPNFGMVLYHEDILRILTYYTGWEAERCNRLRRDLFRAPKKVAKEDLADYQELCQIVPPQVVQLILDKAPTSFCLPHAVAFASLTKASAILQTLHRDIYFEEIAKWEGKNKFKWDDIGVAWEGFSMLQT